MAKEKTQNVGTKENERLFHYEILGIILLILSMLAIAKMGLIGKYLMLTVKVLFGDWYFLIFLLMIFYAIRCIIVHRRLKINNIRYLGIFISILSLILLSHFSMHRYVKNYEGNSLVTTIQLYFNSFKTENAESIVGGGIIGASLFYLCYYLLSEVGVILISILLFFLGIVFICKKTIKDFIKMMIAFFKRVYALLNKTGKKLRNKIDEYDLSYTKSKVKFKISKINNTEYYNREYEFAKRNVETIKKVLNSMNVFYNDITYIICRNITVYFISSHYHFSYEAFGRNLKNYIHNFQLKQDENSQELLVEINNLAPTPLRIYELEKLENNEIIFGMDDRNEFIKLEGENTRLLIFSINKKRLQTYFDTIIVSLMHYKSNIEYYYIDLLGNSTLATSNNIDELDHILIRINERITKFNELKVSNIDEYNRKSSKKENYELVMIVGIDKILNDNKLFEKLMYMLEVTTTYGYFYIFHTSDESVKYTNLLNLFQYKIFLEKENEYSKKYLGYQRFDLLNNEVEGYLLYKSIILRMTLLQMTDNEIESLKK